MVNNTRFYLNIIHKIQLTFFILTTLAEGVFSQEIPFYITSTTQVGTGAVHKKIIAPSAPWTINVLELDLTDSYLTLESVKAKDLVAGNETTSSMARRIDFDEHQSVGAINGDFYSAGGTPINNQVINGRLVKSVDRNNKSAFAYGHEKSPSINITNFKGSVFANGNTININSVNGSRGTNQLVLYNSFIGSSTQTNQYGTEIQLTAISDWIVNDTVFCVVDLIESGIGSMEIGKNKTVLSGHGLSSSYLSEYVEQGDTLKLLLTLTPSPLKIKQLIGGFVRIVKNGYDYSGTSYPEEGGSSNFCSARHPRTAIGFSSDSTVLYFVTVDGRQSISKGMTCSELANLMIYLGASDAVNLDGGGSTTMVVRNEIENSPSDGTERAVANALVAVSMAPQSELHAIQIEPDNPRIYKGEQIKFNVTGWDSNYGPKSINKNQLQYSLGNEFGTISDEGILLTSDSSNGGYVYVNYNGRRDSAVVFIKSIAEIKISPSTVVTDTIQTIRFYINAYDEDGIERPISRSDCDWYSLNSEIGVIDSSGLFKGNSAGQVKIVVRHGDISDTSSVTVDPNFIKKIDISPKSSITDTIKMIQFSVKAFDKNGKSYSISNSDYKWSVQNENIGSINNQGTFKGRSSGTTIIVAQYVNTTDTAFIKVEIGEGKILIDDMENTEIWQMSGSYYDSENSNISQIEEPKTSGDGALKIDYTFIRNRRHSKIFLDTDKPFFFGIPDSIKIDFKSNGEKHRIYFTIKDHNNVLFEGFTGKYATRSEYYDTLSIGMSDFEALDSDDDMTFPISFSRITMDLGYYGSVGDSNVGTVYLDNLRLVYPNFETRIDDKYHIVPSTTKLNQNYPNPFNPTTTITFQTAISGKVNLSIFNLVGQRVTTLVDQALTHGQYNTHWQPNGIPSGIYLYRLQTSDGQTKTRKLIYIK